MDEVPVERYRSVEEVPPPPASDDPATNLRRVLAVSDLCVRLARTEAVRGVQRFATITEANASPRRRPSGGQLLGPHGGA
ncbi:MAG: hypothetical protein WD080_07285 [Egibacteraceae bacterium]